MTLISYAWQIFSWPLETQTLLEMRKFIRVEMQKLLEMRKLLETQKLLEVQNY